jgi:hypothetical protein
VKRPTPIPPRWSPCKGAELPALERYLENAIPGAGSVSFRRTSWPGGSPRPENEFEKSFDDGAQGPFDKWVPL